MLRLKSKKVFPKDGFPFIHPVTGRVFGGMFSFAYNSKEIYQHELDNKIPGTSLQSAEDKLEAYTVSRHPELAYDPGNRRPEEPRRGGCVGCGGHPM